MCKFLYNYNYHLQPLASLYSLAELHLAHPLTYYGFKLAA